MDKTGGAEEEEKNLVGVFSNIRNEGTAVPSPPRRSRGTRGSGEACNGRQYNQVKRPERHSTFDYSPLILR